MWTLGPAVKLVPLVEQQYYYHKNNRLIDYVASLKIGLFSAIIRLILLKMSFRKDNIKDQLSF